MFFYASYVLIFEVEGGEGIKRKRLKENSQAGIWMTRLKFHDFLFNGFVNNAVFGSIQPDPFKRKPQT